MSKVAHQQPIQVHLINQPCSFTGLSFMFRQGDKMVITKRVDDLKAKKSVFQGHYFNEASKTCVEVQFDAFTGKHLDYPELATDRGTYRITLNMNDMTDVPVMPTFE